MKSIRLAGAAQFSAGGTVSAAGWRVWMIPVLAWVATVSTAAQVRVPRIPVREGLTVVTAVHESVGDYESIKRFVSVDDKAIRIKYSSESPIDATESTKPTEYAHVLDFPQGDKMIPQMALLSTTVYRTVLREDLRQADHYLFRFVPPPLVPEAVPGTTAIGTSAAVLTDLKTKGESQITVYSGVLSPMTQADAAGFFDTRERGTIKRVEPGPVPIPVVVNGKLVNLPAIHAKGQLVIDAGDFYFLDDAANPIALRYAVGQDKLTVIKIDFPGETTMADSGIGQPAGSQSAGISMEEALAKSGHVDVYGIYFSFNSDKIREESEPVLKEIAGILTAHPEWKLNVDGHTDNIGGAAFNLDLSNRRAAAVKRALAERYHIQPARLTTAGYGFSRPKATNDTLEGRALNRRVELVRQ